MGFTDLFLLLVLDVGPDISPPALQLIIIEILQKMFGRVLGNGTSSAAITSSANQLINTDWSAIKTFLLEQDINTLPT